MNCITQVESPPLIPKLLPKFVRQTSNRAEVVVSCGSTIIANVIIYINYMRRVKFNQNVAFSLPILQVSSFHRCTVSSPINVSEYIWQKDSHMIAGRHNRLVSICI